MSVRNIFDKTPLQLSGAIVAFVNFLILVDAVNMTAEAVSGLNVALVALLGLFVATKTANKAVLNEVQELFEQEGA